jgi:hypothetical protein
MFQQTCVETCPFGFLQNDSTQACDTAGQLQVPFPFTVITIVISIGVGISAFLKGSDKRGNAQEGTAFF